MFHFMIPHASRHRLLTLVLFTLSMAMPAHAQDDAQDAWLDTLMQDYEADLTQRGTLVEPAAPPPPWMSDPLGHLGELMDGVVDHLDQADTGETTQTEQARIIEDMELLIAIMEEQKNGSGGGGGQGQGGSPGTSPAPGLGRGSGLNDSVLRNGSGTGDADLASRDNAMDFPELNDAQRQRLLQSQIEGLPPGYATLYEEYLYRLSRGGSADQREEEAP